MVTVTTDSSQQAQIVSVLCEKLLNLYVFPHVASDVAQSITTRLERGDYAATTDGEAFAEILTQHLQELSQDRHLRVEVEEPAQAADASPEEEDSEEDTFRERTRLVNNCIRKLERMPGNVGYMNLTGFVPPEWGAETLVAAMAFLAHVSALIIDVRECRGGHMRMAPILCSYFFNEPTHLSDFYWRPEDETTQSWTLHHVPGKRLPGIPLTILTSKDTFSAGEDFAYTMQSHKRARIVGEVTRGGAHPGEHYVLHGSFSAFIPSGRPIHPITKANWEGTGVIPDVKVSREVALDTAYALALQDVIDGILAAPSRPHENVLKEAQRTLAEQKAGS